MKRRRSYKYDIIKNVDELRKEVRAVEHELEISGASKPENTATHQPVSAVSDMSDYSRFKFRFWSLLIELLT
jgi:hypothetical protein